MIHFQQRAVADLRHPKKYGFVITNPPYGERIEEKANLPKLYREIGEAYATLDSWSMYMITSYEDAEKYIDAYLADFRRECYKDCSDDIARYEIVIEKANKKMDKLLQMNIDGKLSDIDFERMMKKCQCEVKEAQSAIDELNDASKNMKETAKELRQIKSHLKEAVKNVQENKEITVSFINKYINKIGAEPEEDGSLTLYIHLFSNEVLQKSLVRTGHTFKKMIESYERNMK